MTKLQNPGFLRFFIPRYQRQPPPPFKKNQKKRVILSPFYARCYAKQQPQSQPGIKRVKDLAELLRHLKSQAQATIACCLGSFFSKNHPGQRAPTGMFDSWLGNDV